MRITFYLQRFPLDQKPCPIQHHYFLYNLPNQGHPKQYTEVLTMKVMLNQILDNKGISQNQLAKDTGISVNTLRNLSHNRTTRISFYVLEKICICLDCGVEDILCVEK